MDLVLDPSIISAFHLDCVAPSHDYSVGVGYGPLETSESIKTLMLDDEASQNAVV